MNLSKLLFPTYSDGFIKKTGKIVKAVNALEEEVSKLSDSDFPLKTQELKEKMQKRYHMQLHFICQAM